MNLDSIKKQYPLRVHELMLILRGVKLDWLNKESCSNPTYLSNFYDWTKELLDLIGEEEYATFMFEAICQPHVLIPDNNQTLNTFVDQLNYRDLLATIEQYQKSSPPLQERNFDEQIYYSHYLSTRIELLYKIGKQANILSIEQAFDSYTKVTQSTQDVCDLVRQWVENNLRIKLLPLNVYEPFIVDYREHSYLRVKKLREIGVRAGLLPEVEVDDELKLSPSEAKTVINWLKETYKINLPFPDSHQLTAESSLTRLNKNSTERQGKNKLTNVIGVAFVCVLLFAVYNQFNSFITLEQHEYGLGQKNSKSTLPLKAKQTTSKSSN